MVFRTKSSTTGEIYSMYHLAVQGRVSLKNSLSGLSSSMQILICKTKGSAGPSGMDSELYRRILCSKNFKTEGKILREEIAVSTRNLLKKSYHPSLLEAFAACRLIPLDKNPGIRPATKQLSNKATLNQSNLIRMFSTGVNMSTRFT